jgi:hypothetical protein
MGTINRIVQAVPLDDYRLKIIYDDGFEKIIDLKDKLTSGKAEELRDEKTFRNVHIGTSGELYWDNGYDLCPVSLRIL